MSESETELLSIADVAHKAAVAVLDLHGLEEAVGCQMLQGFPECHTLEYIVAFDVTTPTAKGMGFLAGDL